MNQYDENQKENLDLSNAFDDVIKQKSLGQSGARRYKKQIQTKKKNKILIIAIILCWILAAVFFFIKKANEPEEKYIISPDQYIKKFLRD